MNPLERTEVMTRLAAMQDACTAKTTQLKINRTTFASRIAAGYTTEEAILMKKYSKGKRHE